ncbi:hypothetical protein K469DRAFT_690664 [Zopfia rhizophila CBS 207.26]|uniref:Amidohydrolase-related domain-containing protein n=1 Tax=Zopfia rhizophila CBS 207.26 TaxID=1314779 RepID=A0A6A6DXZ6_9PEZI|nr:hypothetical protein K469DRAFT_690664 [Zopfia rhizophila CBS 207.26]
MPNTTNPSNLLDTHIHLWPGTSVSPTNHGWMTPGHQLAKCHGISDYMSTTQRTSLVQPSGFVYVETDRYLPSPAPSISSQEVEAIKTQNEGVEGKARKKLEQWAHEPLEELKFLRRVVEGTPSEGDGFKVGDGEKMKGCVIWAPFHLPAPLFDLYLSIVEEVAGKKMWERVVGFRYLLQGIKEEAEMRKVVKSPDWLANLLALRKGRGGKGWTFDIGIDAHSGGVWQVEVAADMVEKIRKEEGDGRDGRVKFILNHLCKPDLSHSTPNPRWLSAIQRLAAQPAVYMKFSGAFNEFGTQAPSSTSDVLERLSFYAENVFAIFTPERVMFGSDWPVCNIGGAEGENSWGVWRQVVEAWVEREKQWVWRDWKKWVWWRTGIEAYGIEGL